MSKILAKWINYDPAVLANNNTQLTLVTGSFLPISASYAAVAETASYVAGLELKADKSTQIIAGTGLTGGGDLSTDRTLELTADSIASMSLADTALQPGDNISELVNDSEYVLSSQTSSMTVLSASYAGYADEAGHAVTADSASYILWDDVDNKPDPTITVNGDVTGTVTLTDLGNGTLTTTLKTGVVSGSSQIIHNDTIGLQGGIGPDEYYHLGQGAYANIADGTGSSPEFVSITTTGGASFGGNVVVEGTITAQEIIIQSVTRSIIEQSGSTTFGDSLDDTHEITGSTYITGSEFTFNGQDVVTVDLLGTDRVVWQYQIDGTDQANGYFTLPFAPRDEGSVILTVVGGPQQVNKDIDGLVATPDFQVILSSGNRLYFNNNGAATGLSAHLANGDVITVEYLRLL